MLIPIARIFWHNSANNKYFYDITQRFSCVVNFFKSQNTTRKDNWPLSTIGIPVVKIVKRLKLCVCDLVNTHQNVPIASILTDFKLGSRKDFDLGRSDWFKRNSMDNLFQCSAA